MPWPAEVEIDCSATGDNVIVPGVVDQTIEVYQLYLVVSANTLLSFKNGPSIEFDPPMTMLLGGAIVFDGAKRHMDADRPWFRTDPGNAFIINQTGSAQISGRLYFRRGLP